MQLVGTIQQAIERDGRIPAGARLVAGVSGGADSVALLRALHQLGFPVTVAHLNHQLRGTESDADEQFVCALAEELELPMVVKRVDVRSLAGPSGLSMEMAARQARHAFFSEFEDSVTALGHHADDQVETFILKLARGAGTEGLGGMPFYQEIGPLRLIRPMLEIPRADIIAWLQSNGYAWREDASNSDAAFLRNRVRHTVLPVLERELNPGIRGAILRTMNILRMENAWMESMVDEASCFVAPNESGAAAAKQAASSTVPLAAKRRLLRKWLFENAAENVDFDAVDKILSLMETGNGTTVFELNNRQRVVVEYGKPRFERVEQVSLPAQGRPRFCVTIENGTGWRKDHGRGAGILPAEASFDADKVGDAPIEVRAWQPGDRMTPFGMEGRRKLQDIFTDQKITRVQRPGVPVVVCRNEIIWLPGYRTARGWEVQGPNGKAVHVRIEPD